MQTAFGSKSHWLAILIGIAMTTSASAFGRNPWSSEVGDARAVQSKTEDISERLRDKFPFCPATSVSLRLDQTANQLESFIESGSSWNQVQSSLRQTRSLSSHVHRLASGDHHVRADKRLMNYFGELNKRLDKLDYELQKAYTKQPIDFYPPVHGHVQHHGHYPQYGHQYSAGYPQFHDSVSGWNKPFYNGTSPISNQWSRPSGGTKIDIQIVPPVRKPILLPEVVPPVRVRPSPPMPPGHSGPIRKTVPGTLSFEF